MAAHKSSMVFTACIAVAMLHAPSRAAVSDDTLAPAAGAMTAAQTANSAVPTQHVAPVSVTATATTTLPPQSDFVTTAPDALPRGALGPPVFAGLSLAEIMIIGGTVMTIVLLARRRHRRRVGWGVMPERPSLWNRLAD